MQTKRNQILSVLMAGTTLTRATALVSMKVPNLSAEISALRSRGHVILTERATDGAGDPYLRYRYIRTLARRPVMQRATANKGTPTRAGGWKDGRTGGKPTAAPTRTPTTAGYGTKKGGKKGGKGK